jgi:hypothetical protein
MRGNSHVRFLGGKRRGNPPDPADKSPDDYFSVSEFYKVLSYAFLYAALNKTPIEDLTLSIIETRHPRELFKHVEAERLGGIRETAPGICQIAGYPLPIQVIESKKLPAEENLWLRGLTKDLNAKAARSILDLFNNPVGCLTSLAKCSVVCLFKRLLFRN